LSSLIGGDGALSDAQDGLAFETRFAVLPFLGYSFFCSCFLTTDEPFLSRLAYRAGAGVTTYFGERGVIIGPSIALDLAVLCALKSGVIDQSVVAPNVLISHYTLCRVSGHT